MADKSIASFENSTVHSVNINEDNIEDIPPDSPKWAIFYFVFYTIFSTYNLIAGKFFRTWYP